MLMTQPVIGSWMVELSQFVNSLGMAVLAVVAIGLSVAFFYFSLKLAHRSEDAAAGIKSCVDRLEALFDKMYSDTHGQNVVLTKEIIALARTNAAQKDAEADEQDEQMREQGIFGFTKVAEASDVEAPALEAMKDKVEAILKTTIAGARMAERLANLSEEAFHAYDSLTGMGGRQEVWALVDVVVMAGGCSVHDGRMAIKDLVRAGLVTLYRDPPTPDGLLYVELVGPPEAEQPEE